MLCLLYSVYTQEICTARHRCVKHECHVEEQPVSIHPAKVLFRTAWQAHDCCIITAMLCCGYAREDCSFDTASNWIACEDWSFRSVLGIQRSRSIHAIGGSIRTSRARSSQYVIIFSWKISQAIRYLLARLKSLSCGRRRGPTAHRKAIVQTYAARSAHGARPVSAMEWSVSRTYLSESM